MTTKSEVTQERQFKFLCDSMALIRQMLFEAENYRRGRGAYFCRAFHDPLERRRLEQFYLKPVQEAACAIKTAEEQVRGLPPELMIMALRAEIDAANRKCCLHRVRWELGMASIARTEGEAQERIQRAQGLLARTVVEGVETDWLDAGYYAEDIEALLKDALLRENEDHLNEAEHLLQVPPHAG